MEEALLEQVVEETAIQRTYGSTCPVCTARAFTLLAPVWRNYHIPAEFAVDPIRWFAECNICGTVVMLPLHDDFETGGTVYYDQKDIEAHARHHFESFQRPNYDHIRGFLRSTHPPEAFRRWLDVGSVGYPTTFADYEFTTIEPDSRAAQAGEAMFHTGRIHAATIDAWTDARAYDGILFNNSFYCLTDPGQALDAARRLLRPDGRLVITLSSSFADATSDYEDGHLLLIEQVIFGETLQVYYNQHSLTYLAERHGFRLVDITEVPAYGCKTMQVHVFERADGPRCTPALLDQSRSQMARKWSECFAGFTASIVETLAAINNESTVLAGSLAVIRDLTRYGDLSRTRGILPFPEPRVAGATVNGLRVLSVDDLRDVEPDEYRVVVCAFRNADAVVANLQALLGEDIQLLLPTRRSGMDYIDFSFRDGRYPSKGFRLHARPRGRSRIRVRGKRTVVYGAGAGGREAVALLDAAGARVVGLCDSDARTHGTSIAGHRVQPFTVFDRHTFDLVVIASRPGFVAIAERLQTAGLDPARDFVGLDDLEDRILPSRR